MGVSIDKAGYVNLTIGLFVLTMLICRLRTRTDPAKSADSSWPTSMTTQTTWRHLPVRASGSHDRESIYIFKLWSGKDSWFETATREQPSTAVLSDRLNLRRRGSVSTTPTLNMSRL